MALKRAVGLDLGCSQSEDELASESVEGASLALEGVDDVHGGDGLPLGVLAVGDGVTDDVLKEHLQDTTSLLVDESGDALDSSSAGETADGGLGDSLDVVAKNLAMALGSSLSESLSSLSAARHDDCYSTNEMPVLPRPCLYRAASTRRGRDASGRGAKERENGCKREFINE